MRTAWYAFYYSVVVRRVGTGSTPFRWEVQAADGLVPTHVSSERFRSMQAAYEAGQVWLADSPALPLPRIALSTTMSMDEDSALPDQDEDIDPALDTLDEGFISTVASVYSTNIG
jgi:hypothetical protein